MSTSFPTTDAAMADYLEACHQRAQVAFATLVAITRTHGMLRLTPVDTGSGIELIASQVRYRKGTTELEVIGATAEVEAITATADGRQAICNVWHDPDLDGPFGEGVYAELWTPAGRIFHGWVDAVSRKLVQTG